MSRFGLQGKNILNDNVSSIDYPSWLTNQIEPSLALVPLNSNLLDHTTQIYALGSVLYTTYAWHLIIASLILLVAMLGSIVLTLNKSSIGVQQQIYEQNLRDYRLTVAKHS